MTDTLDPTPRWSRELANLRTRASQLRRASAEAAPEVVDAALTACDGLLRDLAGAHLECERLRTEVRTETAAWEHLFGVMPGACVVTDSTGSILNANRAAGVLLNTSAKHLRDRQLLVFSEDREAFGALLHRLARGGEHVSTTIAVRPRERKAAAMDVTVAPLSTEDAADWVWFLSPNNDSQKTAGDDVGAAQTTMSASR